jgi:FLVCR family MFS transporter
MGSAPDPALGEQLLAPKGGGAAAAATVSPWRYYILATYSLLAALQGLTWSVPGTLQPTFAAVYGMDQDTVQLLLNYGPIFYIVAMLPVAWSIDRQGIRAATVSGIALVVAANVMRCFANDGSLLSLALVHLSFILNAVAGPAAMAVPSKLAEDWFSPTERTTATAVAALANQSGVVFLYLLVPTVAPNADPADNLRLNLILAGFSVLNALMCALYFPSHPPRAPSASAGVSKGNEAGITAAGLVRACRALLANRGYVAIVAVYALFVGCSNATGALLTGNLQALGADLTTAGWIGFSANLASLVIGVGISSATDRLKRALGGGALKGALVASVAGAGACFVAYTVLLTGAAGASATVLWATAVAYVGASALLGAAIPIMFDLGAELTFPIPEGTMLMFATGAMNAVSLVVLAAPASSFFLWANPATAVCGLGGGLLLLLAVPHSAPRLEYDLAAGGEGGGGAARADSSGSFLGDSDVGGEREGDGDDEEKHSLNV